MVDKVKRVPLKKKEEVKRKAPERKPGQFQPGHKLSVGNRGPAAKLAKRFMTAVLLDELQRMDPKDRLQFMRKIVRTQINLAMAGDMHAINSIYDRAEGRPVQAVELSGRDGKPIETITAEMPADEAARVYAQILKGDDSDDK